MYVEGRNRDLTTCVCIYVQDYMCVCVCIHTKPWICMCIYKATGKYRSVNANAPVYITGAWEWGGVQAAMGVTCADPTFLHLPRDQVAHKFHPLTRKPEGVVQGQFWPQRRENIILHCYEKLPSRLWAATRHTHPVWESDGTGVYFILCLPLIRAVPATSPLSPPPCLTEYSNNTQGENILNDNFVWTSKENLFLMLLFHKSPL